MRVISRRTCRLARIELSRMACQLKVSLTGPTRIEVLFTPLHQIAAWSRSCAFDVHVAAVLTHRLGLQVLTTWPYIYSALNGTATLSVLYGFTPAFIKSLPTFYGSRASQWHQEMLVLLQQPGVRYVGLVDHETLAKEYANAGFILYPTSFPETGCFALMKVRCLLWGGSPASLHHVFMYSTGDGHGGHPNHKPF
jgi:hypothetical protein